MTDRPPVHLLKGDEPTLLADAVSDLVAELVGDDDASLVVEELDGTSYAAGDGDPAVEPIVNAAQTPPFLTGRRVVVAREVGQFAGADRVAPLVDYLAAPLDTTTLVLVWEKAPGQQRLGAVPKALTAAVQAAGGTTRSVGAPRSKRERTDWFADELARAGLHLDAEASRVLTEHLGEDVGRLRSVLATVAAAYGPGARVSVDELVPYLGAEGDVAPWELTDAIDRGDIPVALDRLHRLLGGGRHPLQLMFTLQSHYGHQLALDGAAAADERAVGELTGLRGFPAKKALELSRRLRAEQVAEAIRLLAQADLDLRGAKAWSPELVMEVLVARLAHRCSTRRG